MGDQPDDGPPVDVDDRPRDGADVDAYPGWWRRNVEEFREYGLAAYRPPRFEDGELVPPVVADLEAEIGRSIQLRVVDPQAGNRWTVAVDGEAVASVARDRHVDGYSVFHVTAAEFERLVREG